MGGVKVERGSVVAVEADYEAWLRMFELYDRILEEVERLVREGRGFRVTVVENRAWVEPLEAAEREHVRVTLHPASLTVEGFLRPERAGLLRPLTDLAKCARVGFHAAAAYLPHLDHHFLGSGVSFAAEIVFTEY
jgi:hypothetical protein